METKAIYKFTLSPQLEMTELEYLNLAKLRYKEASANVSEGWFQRDVVVEAHDVELIHEWDKTLEILMALRDRAYHTLQLAHLRFDAAGDCVCTPIDCAVSRCRACEAQAQLAGDKIPW